MVPAHQGCCARAPRLLCPFTKATVPVHQGYCARSPRLLCPHTKTASPVHQGCFARSPRLLCPFTKAAVLVQQDCCARAPRLIYPCTQLGTRPNLPDSRAHQACHPLMSGRCAKPRRLATAPTRPHPAAPYPVLFVIFVPFVVPHSTGTAGSLPPPTVQHPAFLPTFRAFRVFRRPFGYCALRWWAARACRARNSPARTREPATWVRSACWRARSRASGRLAVV